MFHNLSTGIQEFSELIGEGCIYVDKTQLIHTLIVNKRPFFLSRPRRFGKSLLVSTMAALFEGKKELFKGLWIEQSDWAWPVHPVVRLDMSLASKQTPEEFEQALIALINSAAKTHGIQLSYPSASLRLSELIEEIGRHNKW